MVTTRRRNDNLPTEANDGIDDAAEYDLRLRCVGDVVIVAVPSFVVVPFQVEIIIVRFDVRILVALGGDVIFV